MQIKAYILVHNIHAKFKPTNTLAFPFSKLRDEDPLLNQNNLAYKIDCSDCNER